MLTDRAVRSKAASSTGRFYATINIIRTPVGLFTLNYARTGIMEYLDFEIEIAHGDRVDYPLAVIHSPAGENRTTSTLPFSQIELENRILTLKNVMLRSGGQHRRALTPDELTVRNFGQDLFDALFTGDVGSLYHESRRQAERQDPANCASSRPNWRPCPGSFSSTGAVMSSSASRPLRRWSAIWRRRRLYVRWP